MKLNIVLAALLALGATASQAASYTFTTDAMANSTAGGTGADVVGGGLGLTTGESFTVDTDPSQLWHGALPGDGNYDTLTSNADGTTSTAWMVGLPGAGAVEIGTLVAEIGGDFRVIGAGEHSFTAWATGDIQFFYADVNNYDNTGAMTSTLTTAAAVPEPANMALLLAGLGLTGVVARRRAASRK